MCQSTIISTNTDFLAFAITEVRESLETTFTHPSM